MTRRSRYSIEVRMGQRNAFWFPFGKNIHEEGVSCLSDDRRERETISDLFFPESADLPLCSAGQLS